MNRIYALVSGYRKKTVNSLIGQYDNALYSLSLEKNIKSNKVYSTLRKSFQYCEIKKGDTASKALFSYGKIYGGSESRTYYKLIELLSKPGAFYPRIYRPIIKEEQGISFAYDIRNELEKLKNELLEFSEYYPHDEKKQLLSITQLAILKEMLLDIFNVLHPSSANLKSFGPTIKNLLILSCIEVETQLKGILKVNEHTTKSNYTTKDYFKLKQVLRLDKYDVQFPFYPELKTI